MAKTRTRFAPSPTGYLHIGGLRTALFSYLFARHNNGEFILRIEDTDRTRYVEGALEDIIDSLKWIGIEWDEGPDVGGPYGPYLQSERKNLYESFAQTLVAKDKAYKCFCTMERLQKLREEQKRKGAAQGYDRHCRSLSDREFVDHEKNEDPFVVRLKVPLQGHTVFEDKIRGNITTNNDTLDDLVLLKSDGYPTYHLANVIDDHLMEITHVIRGDEWISSTPRHVLLYEAFEWLPPFFAHVPVILAKTGGKLSKRHGATMVREFRQNGYVSEALLNFIALLGWSLDDKTEYFTMEELIHNFDLERVNKASAVFSYEKLDWFNGVYIRKMDSHKLYDLLLPHLILSGLITAEEAKHSKEYILNIIPLIMERLKYLSDVVDLTWFFFDDHFEIKEKEYLISKKLSKEDALRILKTATSILEPLSCFDQTSIEENLRNLVEELGLKAGQVFMTLRVAITGTRVSPGLFETMEVLGRERVLQRLKSAFTVLGH
jgi:glutamyl-tRNA synthetase